MAVLHEGVTIRHPQAGFPPSAYLIRDRKSWDLFPWQGVTDFWVERSANNLLPRKIPRTFWGLQKWVNNRERFDALAVLKILCIQGAATTFESAGDYQ